MFDYTKLQHEIESLIALKQEGSFWDFKEDYSDNKADFLHDIICMANNLENRDSYIIFGVNNSREVVGIEASTKRKDQEAIIRFLRDKKFAGGIRPSVHLVTITINGKVLDVLIIKESTQTPFHIIEDFVDRGRTVRANSIYTRVGDTNTPIDKTADIDKVEHLWKKRFGIDLSIFERLHIALSDWENWGVYSGRFGNNEFIQGGNWGNQDYIIHRLFPEFRIELDKESHQEWDCETMRCFYINQTAGHWNAKVFYNNTEIFTFLIAHVDEYRKYLPVPNTASFKNEERAKEKGPRYGGGLADTTVCFYYLSKDSIEGKVLRIMTGGKFNMESRSSLLEKYWLLLFESDSERDEFIQFAEANPSLYKVGLKNGEYGKGDEERGAHFPMNDSNNAYRFYVEFMITVKGKPRADYERYLRLHEEFLSK